jgi:hypothetical protein
MPSINSQPVLPGVYDQVQQQLLASVTGGIRVAAYIGTGRLTNLVAGEVVTRGATSTDALAHTATVLDGSTITDANYATYEAGVDYSATPVSGGVEWLSGPISLTGKLSDPYAGLSGKTFQVSVAGGPIQTFTFSTETTAVEVAALINATSVQFNATTPEVPVPTLATASTYAVLGDTTVTAASTGTGTALTGDLGNVAATSITGFPNGTYTGTLHSGDTAAGTANTDAHTAYTAFAALPVTTNLTGQDLGTLTLAPGVYKFNSSAQLTGTLTLDAGGNPNAQWVFQIGSTLTTASASSVVLIHGASAGNVYWQVGSSATLGTTTALQGTIIALASITADTGATVQGRLIALTGAVTLDHNTVTVVPGTSPSGALTITTVAGFNSSLTIENGTANSILGFVAGSLVSTPSQPALGVKYYVNYEWAKAIGDGQNSFQPQFFFVQNFSTIINAMGTVGGGDSQTANMLGAWTLPVAARLAQQNGASIVCLMQMNPADGSNASQVRAALQKLFIPNINIVVSLDAADNAMLIPDITAHVETASSTINRLERTAFIGFLAGSNPTMLGYATAASSNRVVVVNQTNTVYSMFIGTNTLPSVVDGTMMAAALAALRTDPAYDVAQPLTREIVSGISTTNTLAQAEKVILSNGGVLIVDNISGSPKVVFGTTTSFATILNQLYQVTEITDYCAQTLRGLLDPIFIGQKLLTNTPSQVETVSGAIMQTIEDANIIESFVQPTATVNPVQPTQILLQVGIQPVLELDTILITLGLNLA